MLAVILGRAAVDTGHKVGTFSDQHWVLSLIAISDQSSPLKGSVTSRRGSRALFSIVQDLRCERDRLDGLPVAEKAT